ncbi:hypothetical protein PRIPAC_90942 [Pristionchus pacificus]|uniref:Core domain-containing protein n=1 Tax=Pristionchus pacificus TaxID=54126 RepID=A0A8R1V5C3_PRIPA|nr:hypothetical protein PRIPAC_90942 [Pristionchus pacificus]
MSLGRFANSLRFLPSLRLYSSRLIPQGDLILTKAAKQRLDEILSPEEKLRIEVEGGGCAGFEYKIRLDTTVAPDDLVVKDGEKELVVVDEMSLGYIRGSTVDYVEDLMKASFRVLANPLAEKGCSCGTSFAMK